MDRMHSSKRLLNPPIRNFSELFVAPSPLTSLTRSIRSQQNLVCVSAASNRGVRENDSRWPSMGKAALGRHRREHKGAQLLGIRHRERDDDDNIQDRRHLAAHW